MSVLAKIEVALWLVFLVVWVAAAGWSKKTVRRESAASRVRYIALGFVAGLVWSPAVIRTPWLDMRWLPDEAWVGALGVAFTAAGFGFAFWARATLGKNWSGTVTVKEDHELIERGPYALARHPIYTGVLVALLGMALGYGRVRALLALVAIAIALRVKLATEERFMTEVFGARYEAYRRRVKMLVPLVW